MQSGQLSSTLDTASLAEGKQFSNFVTISLSTIGFPTVLKTQDSDKSFKRDTNIQKPETMAAKYESDAFATPAVLDDFDAMSQSSGVSAATTIFDGATDPRLDILREAQKIVVLACKKFMKAHAKAMEDLEDFGEASLADGFRLEGVQKAWRFVEEVRRGFAGYALDDCQARVNVAALIKRYENEFKKRPYKPVHLASS